MKSFSKQIKYKKGQSFEPQLKQFHSKNCTYKSLANRYFKALPFKQHRNYVSFMKVKSCYNPLRLGTAIVLVSSGIDFVNSPRLYSDRTTR